MKSRRSIALARLRPRMGNAQAQGRILRLSVEVRWYTKHID